MPTFTQRHPLPTALFRLAFGLYALGIAHSAAAASATMTANQSDTGSGQPLPEVLVIGKMDHATLNHAVYQFIYSHAKPTAVIGQIGRWTQGVCPAVYGLQDAYGDFVSRRITSLARSVRAPTLASTSKCTANLEIIFTSDPQAMLDHIASMYRNLLGYYPVTEFKEATTFTRPVQAWYLTGSRSIDGWQPPVCIAGCTAPLQSLNGNGVTPFMINLVIDIPGYAGPTGTAGSYLSHGLRSEFVNVLIIVDNNAVRTSILNRATSVITCWTRFHRSVGIQVNFRDGYTIVGRPHQGP
jgi:hypothetical protein